MSMTNINHAGAPRKGLALVRRPSAEQIARALGGVRSGNGWKAHCPAHDDKNPSLSVSEGQNGIPLVHCFANCSQDEIIKALRNLNLWPQRKQRKWTPAERRAYARHMQEREDAETWAAVAQGIAEDALAAAAPNDLARGSFTKLLLVCREGGAALIEEFRDWRERCPELTAAVVHAGRISQERVQVKAARFVARGCRRAQK